VKKEYRESSLRVFLIIGLVVFLALPEDAAKVVLIVLCISAFQHIKPKELVNRQQFKADAISYVIVD
jgi:hypothetical protein